MKKTVLKRTLSVIAAAAMLGTYTAAGSPAKAQAAPDSNHDDWLHVNENAEPAPCTDVHTDNPPVEEPRSRSLHGKDQRVEEP